MDRQATSFAVDAHHRTPGVLVARYETTTGVADGTGVMLSMPAQTPESVAGTAVEPHSDRRCAWPCRKSLAGGAALRRASWEARGGRGQHQGVLPNLHVLVVLICELRLA